MRSIYIIAAFWSLFTLSVQAQTPPGVVEGHVREADNAPLTGATIYFTGTRQSTETDENGFFRFTPEPGFQRGSLLISMLGYRADTLYITEPGHYDFILAGDATLSTVEISGRQVGTKTERTVQKVETIQQVELTKSACCDLAGCFNTQGSVQVNVTNVVTNAVELRLLGTSGVYNQILVDGMPLMIGNSLTYGVSQISGTWIDRIMVSKGTTSVLQGYDALSGQINIILRKYDTTDPLMFNAYINNFGEKHVNANTSYKAGNLRLSSALHFVSPAAIFDRDRDGLTDLPRIRRFGFYQTVEAGNVQEDGYSSVSIFSYQREERIGGSPSFDPFTHAGSREVYGQWLRTEQPSLITKHYYNWSGRQGIGLYASFQQHRQDSWFGTLSYRSVMDNLWLNAQYENIWNERHILKTGISYRHFVSNEQIAEQDPLSQRNYSGSYLKQEYIPGVFAENTLNLLDDRLSILTGVRLDRFADQRWRLVPRLMASYHLENGWTLRGSIGKGVRTINLFADYPQILAGNRALRIEEPPSPEVSYTQGLSINHSFNRGDWVIESGIDGYYMHFENQVYPDFNADPLYIVIRNARNSSRALSAQANLRLEFAQWLEYKIAYNFLDVYELTDQGKQTLPFINRHRVAQSISIRPLKKPWFLDINTNWSGEQVLPDNTGLPDPYRYPSLAPNYWLVNAQFTYKWKNWDFYGGCENIFDFRQTFPVRGWQDPYGQYFDVSSVWGPTRGREFYLGVRFKIARSDHDHHDHSDHDHDH